MSSDVTVWLLWLSPTVGLGFGLWVGLAERRAIRERAALPDPTVDRHVTFADLPQADGARQRPTR